MPIDVPFADAARVIAGSLENFRQCHGIGAQRHIVKEDAMGLRTLAREQRCARRRADRHARHGLGKIHALSLEAINLRRLDIRIACEAERLRAPLVGDDKEDIRLRRLCSAASTHQPCQQYERQSRESHELRRVKTQVYIAKTRATRTAANALRTLLISCNNGGLCTKVST